MAGQASKPHRYGGPWTEIKLDAVEYYLGCYSRALTAAGFDLWYIDAFAGSGERTVDRLSGGLFEGTPISEITETLAGSARRALSVEPPLHHFVFIEQDPMRCAALERLQLEFPRRHIEVRPGDANEELKKIVLGDPWCRKGAGRSRGVVFLDPYALQVEWQTLQALASTQVLDVWYLFPIRDVVRQLARKRYGIGAKEPKLDRVLGPEWRELYGLPPPEAPAQGSLLDEIERDPRVRSASFLQIEAWFKRRLESEFSYVSDPLPLLTGPRRQAFSLFLAVSNPSRPAMDLAKHFARYVFKNFAPVASRRKPGH